MWRLPDFLLCELRQILGFLREGVYYGEINTAATLEFIKINSPFAAAHLVFVSIFYVEIAQKHYILLQFFRYIDFNVRFLQVVSRVIQDLQCSIIEFLLGFIGVFLW